MADENVCTIPLDIGRLILEHACGEAIERKFKVCSDLALVMAENETVLATAKRMFLPDANPDEAKLFAGSRVAYCEQFGVELIHLNSFPKKLLEIQIDDCMINRLNNPVDVCEIIMLRKVGPLYETYEKILEVMLDGEKGYGLVERIPNFAHMLEDLQNMLKCDLASLLGLDKRGFEIQRDSLLKIDKERAWK